MSRRTTAIATLALCATACSDPGDFGWVAERRCGGAHWTSLPIQVMANDAATAEWGVVIAAAQQWWGPEYFGRARTKHLAFVRTSTAIRDQAFTQASYNKHTCEIIVAAVTLPAAAPDASDVALRVVAHEFGHVLGLADDYAPRSVMHRSVPTVHPELFSLTHADASRLQERYTRTSTAQ